MSINFSRTILSTTDTTVKINITGVKEGKATKSSLEMTLYAFNKHTGGPLFTTTLRFDTIKDIYDYLHSISIIRDDSKSTTGSFIEATDDIIEILEAAKKIGPEAIAPLLAKIASDKKIDELLKALNESELSTLTAAYRQHKFKEEMSILEKLIEYDCRGNIVKEVAKDPNLRHYIASQPEKIFQKWFENNIWVFGIEYLRKHDARKIAFFSEADILMESLDGYLDLIELKRPKTPTDIFIYDKSHNCYHPSSVTSEVIGQSLFYLQKMADFKLNIEKEYKVKVLQPRVKIIIGRTDSFNEQQFESLRMLNSSLVNIQVLSYDYILSCAKKIISQYE